MPARRIRSGQYVHNNIESSNSTKIDFTFCAHTVVRDVSPASTNRTLAALETTKTLMGLVVRGLIYYLITVCEFDDWVIIPGVLLKTKALHIPDSPVTNKKDD